MSKDKLEMVHLPETFHLKQGETLIATLTVCEPVEMFWLGCDFTPTAAFALVEHFFDSSVEGVRSFY